MIKKSIKDSSSDLLLHWNKEFFDSYPLTERIIQEKLIDSIHIVRDGSYSLYNDNEYVGSIVLKFYNGKEEPSCHYAYISLIYVNPKFRKLGYGSMFIQDAKKIAKENGKTSLFVGSDFDNVFCGVFVKDNEETHRFFQKRFKKTYLSYNLICYQPPLIKENLNFVNIEIEDEKNAVLDFIKQNFSYRWHNDVKEASPKEFVVAYDDNKHVIGFVRLCYLESEKLANNMLLYPLYKNLGGIGPLGIDPNLRGKGIGKDLVKYAINVLFSRGCSEVLVDWTGLIDFYKKCGFDEISNEYCGYELKISV